jgi:hypothetical protein
MTTVQKEKGTKRKKTAEKVPITVLLSSDEANFDAYAHFHFNDTEREMTEKGKRKPSHKKVMKRLREKHRDSLDNDSQPDKWLQRQAMKNRKGDTAHATINETASKQGVNLGGLGNNEQQIGGVVAGETKKGDTGMSDGFLKTTTLLQPSRLTNGNHVMCIPTCSKCWVGCYQWPKCGIGGRGCQWRSKWSTKFRQTLP